MLFILLSSKMNILYIYAFVEVYLQNNQAMYITIN